ncbi:hypothetical protein ACFV94_31550 [Streptomyces sp. NPDC059896]|uniref:hypothetical protein n=1 Tax=Streptomyces sp. NPDC059896 TaxID=3346993 RepID=UPI003664164E
MSEITGTATAHEAYAFCCMRCGHGWEQAYDIEHHVDGSGHNFVVYKSEGVRVASPLSSPNCANCGGHLVRIMRSGQVSSVRALMAERHHPAKGKRGAAGKGIPAQAGEGIPAQAGEGIPAQAGEGIPAQAGEEITGGAAGAAPSGEVGATGADKAARQHHWHLSDLLHPFHHRT